MYHIFSGVMLSMYIALDNCKHCDSTPRAAGTVPKAAVLIVPVVDRPPRRHRLRRGSVATVAVTTTLHRLLLTIWLPRRCIPRRRLRHMSCQHPSSRQCNRRCHRRAGNLPERIRRHARCDRRAREYWTGPAMVTVDRRICHTVSPSRRHRHIHNSRICRTVTSQLHYVPVAVSTPIFCMGHPHDQLINQRINRTARLCIHSRDIPHLVALHRRHHHRTQLPRHQYKRRTCHLRR